MRIDFRLFSLLAFLALPAFAGTNPEIPPGQDGGANRPELIRFGDFFLPIARAFGCNDFRWAAFGPGEKSMTLEYVPNGADINRWTRLMTVPLPRDSVAQRDAMMKLEGGLLGAYSKGKILKEVGYTESSGYPRLFLEYEIGEGLQKEHNAGTFLRSGTSSAAFVQIQSRGKPFNEQDSVKMNLLTENHLHLPGN